MLSSVPISWLRLCRKMACGLTASSYVHRFEYQLLAGQNQAVVPGSCCGQVASSEWSPSRLHLACSELSATLVILFSSNQVLLHNQSGKGWTTADRMNALQASPIGPGMRNASIYDERRADNIIASTRGQKDRCACHIFRRANTASRNMLG